MENETRRNKAYGMVEVGRVNCGGDVALCGSNLRHRTTIRLSIKEGYVSRMLNRDWHHSGRTLVEVEMSPYQWAELISSVGCGPSVPCTIRYDGKEHITYDGEEPIREVFDGEFKDSVNKATETVQTAIHSCEELMKKKTLNKADKEQLLDLLSKINRELTDVIPFISKSFGEEMDRAVAHGKLELDAWREAQIHHIASTVLADQIQNGALGDAPKVELPE